MKINKKGQALVEFVLILPIILMILFIVIDLASIFYNKNHLEGVLEDVVLLTQNNKNINEINKVIDDSSISINITSDGEYKTVILEKDVDFITPLAESFFNDDYKITTKRVIFDE